MGAMAPLVTCSSPEGRASTTDGSSPVGRTSLIAGTAASVLLGSGLSVTSDGRNSLSGNMSQSNGNTSLTLNPDSILSGVIALENAIPTIAGMSYIDIVRPLLDTIQPSHAAL